ncbi:glycoside hydrolase family protein [Rubidibacter lacunae]|uniref:glycoside hydrolase family protein n=1 Tax=Rubidibacter lacunae TaxID=582514 RepID=UPI000590F0A3|nr:hypothetical protein [Rubidibacter lacunae]
MRLSSRSKNYEGFRANPYADAIHGWAVPTIVYGTTVYPDGVRVKRGDIVDQPTSMSYLIHFVATEVIPYIQKFPA